MTAMSRRNWVAAAALVTGVFVAGLVTLPRNTPAGEPPAKPAAPPAGAAKSLVDSDFSNGNFAALGWVAKGGWDVFTHPPKTANDPGPVARFPANKPDGTLTKTFPKVSNPRRLRLSLEYGWGWGDASQPADAVAFMLLDDSGNGYVFEVHRCKARWAVQWGRVVGGTPAGERTWAAEEVDASHKSARDGGGLARLTVTREHDGSWRIAGPDWNGGAGGAVRFADATTASFSKLVLVGTKNFDDQLFNKVVMTVPPPTEAETTAAPATRFLDSIGVVTTFPDRGQPLDRTVEMVKYCGFRWVRGGIEGLTEKGPTTLQTYLDLHRQAGVRFSWGLVSGGSDLEKLLATARPLAKAGALLAFEGNNEPNNWGVTYKGEKGGGKAPTWLPVARLQRDLYAAVKADPLLKGYPVWSASEVGGESDNVGLQFLKIPAGRRTLMPEGTAYADAANVHNYVYHPGAPGLADNKAWNAADPTSACKIDGLYGNHGVTWAKRFRGYSEDELVTLPRVTTETGCTIGGAVTEEVQALNLLNMYLAQFKRGWSHTAVYLLRDRTDEAGNQSFGFFKPDYRPRKAAEYLRNLTAILADKRAVAEPGRLNYSIAEQPATVHDLLLRKSDGTFALVVWGERLKGSDEVAVRLGGEFPEVRVYDPTKGVEPVRTERRVAGVRLTVSDHPLVLQFKPE
jgi:hypothetical protein